MSAPLKIRWADFAGVGAVARTKLKFFDRALGQLTGQLWLLARLTWTLDLFPPASFRWDRLTPNNGHWRGRDHIAEFAPSLPDVPRPAQGQHAVYARAAALPQDRSPVRCISRHLATLAPGSLSMTPLCGRPIVKSHDSDDGSLCPLPLPLPVFLEEDKGSDHDVPAASG